MLFNGARIIARTCVISLPHVAPDTLSLTLNGTHVDGCLWETCVIDEGRFELQCRRIRAKIVTLVYFTVPYCKNVKLISRTV